MYEVSRPSDEQALKTLQKTEKSLILALGVPKTQKPQKLGPHRSHSNKTYTQTCGSGSSYCDVQKIREKPRINRCWQVTLLVFKCMGGEAAERALWTFRMVGGRRWARVESQFLWKCLVLCPRHIGPIQQNVCPNDLVVCVKFGSPRWNGPR